VHTAEPALPLLPMSPCQRASTCCLPPGWGPAPTALHHPVMLQPACLDANGMSPEPLHLHSPKPEACFPALHLPLLYDSQACVDQWHCRCNPWLVVLQLFISGELLMPSLA
jgi:hypothetical protein